MKGITSTAPILGCSPSCASMSISWMAAATRRSSAALTGPCSPAIVKTDRLWLASLVRSSRNTSGVVIAAARRSTTSRRRPSETFGTDSISTAARPRASAPGRPARGRPRSPARTRRRRGGGRPSRIGGQDTFELLGGQGRAIRDDDHAGVLREADAHAAAMVDRDPGRPGGGVDKGEEGPVRDRVGAVGHRLGLAVGAGHGPGIEVVAADDYRRADRGRRDELVERQTCPGPPAVTQPADPGRQALEGDARLGHLDPPPQPGIVREELEDGTIGQLDVRRVARERSPAERPRPSQNWGRMKAGTKPG